MVAAHREGHLVTHVDLVAIIASMARSAPSTSRNFGISWKPSTLNGLNYRSATSQIMKSSSVWRILLATNSITVASSTKPRTGVASGIKSNGSIR